jgi:predicted dehydrogenase/D-arabinose 1-dehydrogenase-like Zn-dependent alcohol dehydrogenase
MMLLPNPTAALQRRVNEHLRAALRRAGHSDRSAAEVSFEVFRWGQARLAAAASRRWILEGSGVAWTVTGQAELVRIEVPRPGRHQVAVRIETSAISPGTERAFYLKLPHARASPLTRPGYSAAGIVVEVGRGVTKIRTGDRVAVAGAPHSSVVTIDADAAYTIPDGVPMEAAALVELGVIAGLGVAHSALRPGDPFCVVGIGPIGALAQRLAVAAGGIPRAVVARSGAKRGLAEVAGVERFLLAGDAEEIAALRVPVVIEASGNPAAVSIAVAAAGEGGRVVLLGSPRGVTPHLPVDEIRTRRLELIGSHVGTLALEGATGIPRRRDLAELFLAALGEGRLTVDDLVGPAIDPREAARIYRQLAESSELVGAHFDWSRLPSDERVRRGRLSRVPDFRARGLDSSRPPIHPRRVRDGTLPSVLRLGDPFAGATGNVRIGLIGCGDVARYNAAAVAAAPNATLAVCFDPVAELAHDLAARHGIEAAPTAEALFEHPGVDAVFISVPHHLHAPLTVQAAEAGCHIIVEKPLANTLAGAVEMAKACDRARVALSVSFPQRYDPRVVIARRLIEAGALGKPGGCSIRFFVDRPPAYWLGGFSGRSISDWRSSRERAGGGVLIMNLSHYLDALRHLLGVEADVVEAMTAAVDRPAEVEDAVSLTFSSADGVLASVVGSSAVRGTELTELRLWGHDGHIVIEPDPAVFTLRALDGLITSRWQEFGELPEIDTRAVFVTRFATALAEGRPPEVSAADGIAVQAIIEAAYRSSETGRRVRPEELAREAGWPFAA